MGSSGNIRSLTASKSGILTLKWQGFWSPRAHSKYQIYSWCLASGERGGGKKRHLYLEPSCAITSLTVVTTSVTDFACRKYLQILKFGMFLFTQAYGRNILRNKTGKHMLKSSVIQAHLPQSTPGYSKLKWTETFGILNKRKSKRHKNYCNQKEEKRKKTNRLCDRGIKML